MYETTYPAAAQQANLAGAQTPGRRRDLTLRQNIDAQIELAMKNVDSLKAVKERMEKSGILDMRIDDLEAAIRW